VVKSACDEVTYETIKVQKRHYQNKFIFAKRPWGPGSLARANETEIVVKDSEFGEARCTVERTVRKNHAKKAARKIEIDKRKAVQAAEHEAEQASGNATTKTGNQIETQDES